MNEETKSYNIFLYEKRNEKSMTREEFAKSLGISPFVYSLYEKGIYFPSKRSKKKIEKALCCDFSSFEKGERRYPTPLPYEKTRSENKIDKILSSKGIRIFFLIFFFLSSIFTVLGYCLYSNCLSNSRTFYSENYLRFSDEMRQKGEKTYSLLHELQRPLITDKNEEYTIFLISSEKDESLRRLNGYINFLSDKESLCYSLPDKASEAKNKVEVTYTDYSSMQKYSSFFTRDEDGFSLASSIFNVDRGEIKEGEEYQKLSLKMNSHISSFDTCFSKLILDKLSLSYDFKDLLFDYSKGAKKNGIRESLFLGLATSGVVIFTSSLFFLVYCFLYGKNRKRTHILVNDLLSYDDGEKSEVSERKLPDDVPSFPFIPELLFEIFGILLTTFGIGLVFYNFLMIYSGKEINPTFALNDPRILFISFTIGMFLLYSMDFNVYVRTKRVIRNIFLYGLLFLCLTILEASAIDFLSRTRGIVEIASSYFVIPNTFGSICLYFLIAFFLFLTPRSILKEKKKIVLFRLCSLFPLLWLVFSVLVFAYHKEWGWNLTTFQLYFFNSEGIQFSSICILFLYGLFFLKLFFRKKYGEEKAKRFFFSNRYFLYRNILLCAIIVLVSILEALLSSFGITFDGYYQILLLVPFFLFYKPHLIRRNRIVDRITLISYFLVFGIGYIAVLLSVFVMLLCI